MSKYPLNVMILTKVYFIHPVTLRPWSRRL